MLASGVAVYAALRSVRQPRVILQAVAIGLVAAPLIILLWANVRLDEESYLYSRLALQDYDQDRFASQGPSFQQFFARPVFGHGGGVATPVLKYDPHNVYFRLLFENGVVGVVPVFVLLAGALYFAGRAAVEAVDREYQKLGAVIAAALLGVVLEGVIVDTLHWRNLWVLIGLGWAASAWLAPREGPESN